jgi:hypothetical protein
LTSDSASIRLDSFSSAPSCRKQNMTRQQQQQQARHCPVTQVMQMDVHAIACLTNWLVGAKINNAVLSCMPCWPSSGARDCRTCRPAVAG